MRKVTERAAEALRNHHPYKSGNTEVKAAGGLTEFRMYLHGNCIAVYDYDLQRLWLYDAGWTTATTKERLNGILATFHSEFRIYQLAGVWYVTDGMGARHDWKTGQGFEV